ncbi:FAD-dependent oxidoreductase [Gelidibacter salicanalis]|uniref:FAD-dependent oxidoreductase n=1 Tax=Gelidibacter salicanalis TaxID=291193 RepID=A0A5C7AF95_9FLAO|nr:NAD(P)/FAD-dependent oxidoreductase [Gelidibacter salicanalis]TXE07410.1 FAD-dependent oxidoreductase [Gelidibacter salicanalis]
MIIIIGAGLSGLLTAYRLKSAGIPFKVLEARARIGGRIHTVESAQNTPVEMGATWFGDSHTNLMVLLKELDLNYYEQYMQGTVFYQPLANAPAQEIQLPSQPPSYRISGGTSHLITILSQKLDPADVLCNQEVTNISYQNNTLKVQAAEVFTASRVVLALPPKLWSKKIIFSPPLPKPLTCIAEETHTWMEDAIKVALTYPKPFWRHQDFAGALFSNAGPITEFYDHCNQDVSEFALCGFINPAYKNLSVEDRKSQIVAQLKAVFGTQAAQFLDYKECIWSNEVHTFETSDPPLLPHQHNGHEIFRPPYYDERLFISSAEVASKFPGYMDGAVHVGNATAQKIINLHYL